MSIDLSKVDLSQINNTIIQFRVSAQTKILYITLDTNKKKILKRLVESAVQKLAVSPLEPLEEVEVRKVALDLNIQVSSDSRQDDEKELEKELELKERKLELCKEELEICKKDREELEKYKEKIKQVVNLINLLKNKTIDEKTFVNQMLKLQLL